jgi:hypothetical protein
MAKDKGRKEVKKQKQPKKPKVASTIADSTSK